MGKTYESGTGIVHVHVRFKGEPDRIHLCNKILARCESEWPFSSKYGTTWVCPKCKGFKVSSPRIAPTDIKAAAAQARCKVKIYQFAPSTTCYEGTGGTVSLEGIARDQVELLHTVRPERIHILKGQLFIEPASPNPQKTREEVPMIVQATTIKEARALVPMTAGGETIQ